MMARELCPFRKRASLCPCSLLRERWRSFDVLRCVANMLQCVVVSCCCGSAGLRSFHVLCCIALCASVCCSVLQCSSLPRQRSKSLKSNSESAKCDAYQSRPALQPIGQEMRLDIVTGMKIGIGNVLFTVYFRRISCFLHRHFNHRHFNLVLPREDTSISCSFFF